MVISWSMIAGGDDRGPGLRVVTTADQGCGWCCIKTVALYCIRLHSLIRLHSFGGDAASEEHQTVFGKVLASRDLLDKAVIVARLTKEERQLVIQCDAALKRLGFLFDFNEQIVRGTALRGVFDCDLAVAWPSSK